MASGRFKSFNSPASFAIIISFFHNWSWEDDLCEPQPFWRRQLIAAINGEPIGFFQIIDPFHEESHYWGKVNENLGVIDIWIGEE